MLNFDRHPRRYGNGSPHAVLNSFRLQVDIRNQDKRRKKEQRPSGNNQNWLGNRTHANKLPLLSRK